MSCLASNSRIMPFRVAMQIAERDRVLKSASHLYHPNYSDILPLRYGRRDARTVSILHMSIDSVPSDHKYNEYPSEDQKQFVHQV